MNIHERIDCERGAAKARGPRRQNCLNYSLVKQPLFGICTAFWPFRRGSDEVHFSFLLSPLESVRFRSVSYAARRIGWGCRTSFPAIGSHRKRVEALSKSLGKSFPCSADIIYGKVRSRNRSQDPFLLKQAVPARALAPASATNPFNTCSTTSTAAPRLSRKTLSHGQWRISSLTRTFPTCRTSHQSTVIAETFHSENSFRNCTPHHRKQQHPYERSRAFQGCHEKENTPNGGHVDPSEKAPAPRLPAGP